jgi:hypothetical protein
MEVKMKKANCWEIKKCQRQPGGARVSEMGECIASTDAAHDGRNDGNNAGRYCWRVAGTMCSGKVQGDMAAKIMDCVQCEFFQRVKEEEGLIFIV